MQTKSFISPIYKERIMNISRRLENGILKDKANIYLSLSSLGPKAMQSKSFISSIYKERIMNISRLLRNGFLKEKANIYISHSSLGPKAMQSKERTLALRYNKNLSLRQFLSLYMSCFVTFGNFIFWINLEKGKIFNLHALKKILKLM